MKTLKTLFVFLLVLSTIQTVSVSAQQKEDKEDEVVIFEKKEIKDIEELEARAKKGITDIDETPFKMESEFFKIDKGYRNNKKNIKIKQYRTTQKLKVIETKKGETITSYATTTFLNIPETLLIEEKKEEDTYSGFIHPILNSLSKIFGETRVYAGSRTDDTSGDSGSVRSYSTIYWEERGSGTTNEFRLKSASGGWTILDGSVSISNRTVRLGQSYVVTPDYKPTGNTYSYSAPTTWSWLSMNCSACFVGSTSEVTIKRGTTSWKQVLTNNKKGFAQ